MNKEQATKWVTALRSGKYKQGKGKLVYEGEYCCLGVLCEIEGIKKNDQGRFMGKSSNGSKPYSMSAILTDMTALNLGLKTSDGSTSFGVNGFGEDIGIAKVEYLSLAKANDAGVSFERIATWIENNYEKL